MESEKDVFRILMFPWLAHGHIFPYLELAKRILKRNNFFIYFCSTAINFSSIENFIEDNLLVKSIQLVELHLQPLPELPPHYHTTKNLPPNLLFTLIKAFQNSNSSFSNIITTLKPDLVIYDVFQPWAAKLAFLQGIPAVHFATIGAAALSVIHNQHICGRHDDVFPFPRLRFKDYEMESIETLTEFLYANIFDVDQDFFFGNFKQSCDIVLVKTSERLEGKYMDYISTLSQKNLVPVGLLVTDAHSNAGEDSEIMQWLSRKNLHSTVYISFGSEYFLSREEMEEVAKGLELCDANFIWVIRFPIEDEAISLEEGQEALPQGFLDRVKDRGIVVQGWAPQAKILAHPNTAGFVSHCGWSSLMESLFFGVPIVAMPMQFDQPINARMVVEAGFSVEVMRYENGLMSGEEIAKGINKVFEDKTGESLRFRAKELSEKIRRDEEEDIKEVADQLLLLIKNYKLQKCKSNWV